MVLDVYVNGPYISPMITFMFHVVYNPRTDSGPHFVVRPQVQLMRWFREALVRNARIEDNRSMTSLTMPFDCIELAMIVPGTGSADARVDPDLYANHRQLKSADQDELKDRLFAGIGR